MRLGKVEIYVHNDVVGKPFVTIEATGDASGTDAPALDLKFWAHEVEVVDTRKDK